MPHLHLLFAVFIFALGAYCCWNAYRVGFQGRTDLVRIGSVPLPGAERLRSQFAWLFLLQGIACFAAVIVWMAVGSIQLSMCIWVAATIGLGFRRVILIRGLELFFKSQSVGDDCAPPSSTITYRFGDIGWAGTLFISALWAAAYFYYLGFIGTAVGTWVLEFLQPTIDAISQELGRGYSQGVVYLVSFMVNVGATVLFLLPIRYLITGSAKNLVAGLVCIAPTTAVLVAMAGSTRNLGLLSTTIMPLAGLALFVTMVLLRPQAAALREPQSAHRQW